MKPSEFYEKYWRIKDRHGNVVQPPILTDEEKEFLDNSFSQNKNSYVMLYRTRRRPVTIDCATLRLEMDKYLPFTKRKT